MAGVETPVAGSFESLFVFPERVIVTSLPALAGSMSNEVEVAPGVHVTALQSRVIAWAPLPHHRTTRKAKASFRRKDI